MSSKHIVVVGASAGGIEALRELVAGLPPEFPAPVCVVLHSAPQSPGVLHSILGRAGRLAAQNGRDRERLGTCVAMKMLASKSAGSSAIILRSGAWLPADPPITTMSFLAIVTQANGVRIRSYGCAFRVRRRVMDRRRDQPLEGARVLIVEDEFFIADDLARALRSCGATPVGPVNSVEHADQMLAGGKVDAAILDLNLHGNMAYSLAERLSRERMPCLIISGYGTETVPESLRHVARLEKPVSGPVAMDALSRELAGRIA